MRGVARAHRGRLQSFRFFREDNSEGDRKPVSLHVPWVEKGAVSTWDRQTRTRKVTQEGDPELRAGRSLPRRR